MVGTTLDGKKAGCGVSPIFGQEIFVLFPDTGLIGMTDSLAIRLKKGSFPDGYSLSNCKDGKKSVSGSKDGCLFGTSKHLTWNCKREGKAAHKNSRCILLSKRYSHS